MFSTALFVWLIRYIPPIAAGETYLYTSRWIPTYGINFTSYLDGLSMIFGLLITGIGSLVILYSIYYLSAKESLQNFYIYLLLFQGSMLGVVFTDNLIVLYLFWEMTSIASFLLIAFWFHRKSSRYGAQKSLLITITGGIALLTAFIMLYSMTGTLSVREIVATISNYTDHEMFLPALLLLLLGAFTKSVQFPFHTWLPDAMEAPTPISAYLHSATMVKAGIYLVARFTPVFGSAEIWFWLVSIVGIVTLFWGSFSAIRQTDLKALLAYSTISQLGMIMSMFGIGSAVVHYGYNAESIIFSQAAFAALFHLVNHSTFKGSLFMVVGIVDLQLGTRDIRRLGGLLTFMPISFTVALIGSFSMAGLPPFNGFLSKEMFFTAVLNTSELDLFSLGTWAVLFPLIAWSASVLTFVYCLIIVSKTFFGSDKSNKRERKAHEAPVGMLIAPVVLALLVVGIFFFPNLLADFLLRPAMVSIYPSFTDLNAFIPPISAWHGFNKELLMTLAVVGFGVLIYIFLRHWMRVYTLFPLKWSIDTLYTKALAVLESGSSRFTNVYMTGRLRDYLLYIFLFFAAVAGSALFVTGAFTFDPSEDARVSLYEWVIVFVMIAAAVAIIFAKSRVTAVLLTGVIGFLIAFLFVLFRAPDLALTQVVVETVTTVLFLLCFYFLPEWKIERPASRLSIANLLIAVSVGAVFIAIGLSVQAGKLFPTISSYFENAYELAGGRNIVNTILGDFRALDTMLEVVVLFIAGIGVYTLTKSKAGKRDGNVEGE